MPAQYPVRVYSGGVIVSAGLTMDGKTLEEGSLDSAIISEGGIATNFTISANCIANVLGGRISGFQLYGEDDGFASACGELRVFSGGSAVDTVLHSCGELTMMEDSVASGVTITSQGSVGSYDGYEQIMWFEHVGAGAASVERIVQHELQGVVSGLEFSGHAILGSAGIMQNGMVAEGGVLEVSGGIVSGTAIRGGSAMAESGTRVISAIVSGGSNQGNLQLSSGAVASGLYVGSRGKVSAGGAVLVDLTVASGGSAKLLKGTTCSGTIQIQSGGVFSATTGVTIDFTIASQEPGGTALLNAWNRIVNRNSAAYTLTLAADQADGTYCLAEGAGAFAKTVTVKTDEIPSVTVLTVNAAPLIAGTWFHQLTCSDDVLSYTCSSALVKNPAASVSATGTTFTWDAVTGAAKYQVTLNGGSSWTDCLTTSYQYEGSDSTYFQVRASDGTNAGEATAEIVTAGTAAAVDVSDLADAASANATITLRSGDYTGSDVVNLKANQTLTGQGSANTSVDKAIYGNGNTVTISALHALTNVAGGKVNAGFEDADLTITDSLLKDGFGGSLLRDTSADIGTVTVSVSGTTFRNLYGAGYVTASSETSVLTAAAVNLTVTGNCCGLVAQNGSIYGAGRAAGAKATLAVTGTVSVTVDNGAASKSSSIGGLYTGGYANTGATLEIADTELSVANGWFTKFVAGGSQVYGTGTTGTLGNANVTIQSGIFNNAVIGASYSAGGASATVDAVAVTIAGGSFNGYVCGGGYCNGGTLSVGSVDLTISGGTFNEYIFGGNVDSGDSASASISGQVHLTLGSTSGKISVAKAIYAGSRASGAVGSTLVELVGNGDNLEFSRLYGCGSYSGTQTGGVSGTRELKFNGFTGELQGTLYQFDTFTMIDSKVTFKVEQDLAGISAWNLTLGSNVTASDALLNWEQGSNSFAGDTLDLTFNADSATDLLVIRGGSDLDLTLTNDMTVTFNGTELTDFADGAWSSDTWTLHTVAGDGHKDLVLSRIA